MPGCGQVDADDPGIERVDADLDKLRVHLKVKSDEHHYFCQSTELYKSTEAFPPAERHVRARILLREIRNRDLGLLQGLLLFALYLWQKMLRTFGCDGWLRGPHKRTPTQSLNLQPGKSCV